MAIITAEKPEWVLGDSSQNINRMPVVSHPHEKLFCITSGLQVDFFVPQRHCWINDSCRPNGQYWLREEGRYVSGWDELYSRIK